MTEAIIKQFKARIESLTLIPSDGGRFEISLDGKLVYSKLSTGKFPANEAITQEIAQRLG